MFAITSEEQNPEQSSSSDVVVWENAKNGILSSTIKLTEMMLMNQKKKKSFWIKIVSNYFSQ